MARLLLLRHGQSTWNAEERWQGHADPPLSELGDHQARAAAATAARLGMHALYASDLTRARQTATALAPPGITPVIDPALRERDVGAWTGLTTVEIDAKSPGFRVEHRSPPGFEADDALIARVVPALVAIARGLDDAVVVLVTHGGVIRAGVATWLEMPDAAIFRLGQDYGGVSVVDWIEETPVVRLVNGTLPLAM